MRKSIITGIAVCILLAVFAFVFTKYKVQNTFEYRKYHHEESKGADSSIGPEGMPEDGSVDVDEFASHLPLIIIDINGQDIPNIIKSEGSVREYVDPNVTDPWVMGDVKIINNKDSHNTILDSAQISTKCKIKIRGNSSRRFEKKQYGIKLVDELGEELEMPLLGMEADEDWVLSNSLIDPSLIRNYLAYTVGGQLFPYTPDARFCEVFFKEGTEYQYMGLYLLTESIKRGKGRVDISSFKPNAERLSFIICRDRKDNTRTTLNTWASSDQKCYGYFTFKYPAEKDLTAESVRRIEEEISEIEKVLYSTDPQVFKTYPQYIDVDSFVDYFVLNEFFMNHDAGSNSTYYYQDENKKLTMGPLWDYDNCWDNYSMTPGDPDYMVYVEKPWFEKLIQDPAFQDRLCSRYHELRKNILSDEYLNDVIDDTMTFLGNAAMRESSRWRSVYMQNHALHDAEEGKGFVIERNRNTLEEDIIRLKDVQTLHGQWLDEHMDDFLSAYVNPNIDKDRSHGTSEIAVLAFVAFVSMLAVVRLMLYNR